MTPRERAEALGWVRDEIHRTWHVPGSPVTWWPVGTFYAGQRLAWGAGWRGMWVPGGYGTEDEALAHALLLRDVVLS